MSEFEEYYKSSEWFGTYESDLMMKDAYLAGQQSQQAKIDELQKRIDKAIVQINLHYDSDGMEDIVLSDISEILKGEK